MIKKYLLIGLLALTLCYCDKSWENQQSGKDTREEEIRELYETFDELFKEFLAQTINEMGKKVLKYEEISPGLFPKKITFNGNYYDVGTFVGLMAAKQGLFPDLRTEENREINLEIEKMYEEIFPPFLERARGIAAVYSLNLEDLDLRHLEYRFSLHLWWELFRYDEFMELEGEWDRKPADRCSVISYYIGNEKRHLVGRNWDSITDRPHFLVVSNLSGVFRTVGMTCYQLQNKISDGINQKGLFMAIASNTSPPPYGTYGHENRYPEVPSIWSVHLLRVVLDCCATVNEALALIRKVRIWFPDELQHFLIADALGNSVVIEFDKNSNLHVFPRTDPYLVLTNTAFLEGLDYMYEHCWRFSTATDLCAQGIRNMDEFWEVLCSIQMKSGSHRSLWTSAADLKKLEYDARFWWEDWEIPHLITLKD